MLTTLKKIQYLLRDPISKSDINIKWNNEKIETASSIENNFKISNNLPILINFKKSIVDESFYNNLDLDKSLIEDRSQIKKKIKNFLTRSNFNSKKSIKIFKKNLNKNSKILVIGGGNIGSGLQELYQDSSIDLISTDIYPSDKINFISDCHNIPIKDESVDGVIIQAVLEHVINPNKVINEVYRILKKDGIILAETPFMQSSHEEPYDFHRYTELGHRWLLKSFKEIYRSTNGGPGLSFYWSISSLIYALINNKLISQIFSLPFILFAYLDFLIPERRKIKSANGFVFIGKKVSYEIKVNEITKHFIG